MMLKRIRQAETKQLICDWLATAHQLKNRSSSMATTAGKECDESIEPTGETTPRRRNSRSVKEEDKKDKIPMDSPTEDHQDFGFFKVWLLISQLLGVVSIALVSAWTGQYLGGFSWQTKPNLQFNYHPFFMVLGLIFCYGNALLVYRVFRNQRKRTLKLLHFGLHTFAFIFTVVALKAVFDSHNLPEKPLPNLYSLHSWLGLATVLLFTLQYLCGFIAFLYPGLTKIWRAKYLPVHVFFGLAIFIMAVGAALMGITEKLMFSLQGKYGELPAPGVIGNLLGTCIVMFTILIVYMVATPHFRRRPLPEEVTLQLEQHSPVN